MKRDGFTLIELLTVLVVMGLVVVITIPAVTMIMDRSEQKALEADVAIIHKEAIRKISEERGFDLTSINKNNMKEHLQVNGEIYDSVSIMYVNKKVFITLEKDGLTATNIKNENDLKYEVLFLTQTQANMGGQPTSVYLDYGKNKLLLFNHPFSDPYSWMLYDEYPTSEATPYDVVSPGNTSIPLKKIRQNKPLYLVVGGQGPEIPESEKMVINITYMSYKNNPNKAEPYDTEKYVMPHIYIEAFSMEALEPEFNAWCFSNSSNYDVNLDGCKGLSFAGQGIYFNTFLGLNLNLPIYAFPYNEGPPVG